MFLQIPIALAIAMTLNSGKKPPSFYVDKGACPGEGCSYGKWQAIRNVSLFGTKSEKSTIIATVVKDEFVVSLTGEVDSIPGIFILDKPYEHYQDPSTAHIHNTGDYVYIYTYEGEGYYKFWCNGTMSSGFSPIINSDFKSGHSEMVNGHWLKRPKSTWWIKIRTSQGIVGWTRKPGFFDSSNENN
jgi:hypothetical protein